jgi:hypothetical protein
MSNQVPQHKAVSIAKLRTIPWKYIGVVEVEFHAFLNLALDYMEVSGQLHTLRPIYSQGKSSWYSSDRRLGGPQSRTGRGGEENAGNGTRSPSH